MARRNRKGRFVKGGKAITRYRTRTVTKTRYRSRGRVRRRRHHSRGGRHNLMHLAIAGAGLAYLTSASSPAPSINAALDKVPGSKTFGKTATAGLLCLAADRFIKRNKWLHAAGVVGLVAAAVQAGTQGTGFKWVGDDDFIGDDDDFIGDVEGDDE
jgi:hypothetical protein